MLRVNTEELREVAKEISNRNNEINDTYNRKVKTALEQSKEAIAVSGLNFDEFQKIFSDTFGSVNERLNSLSKALTDEIIPNYEVLAGNISRSFNSDFAVEMSQLLNMK